MAGKKDYNERRDLVAKTVRYHVEDLAYIERLAKRIGIPPGVILRGSIRQTVRMCKRCGDQLPMPYVSVPRNAAEQAGLVSPEEGLDDAQDD
jgi:hypothetical protein